MICDLRCNEAKREREREAEWNVTSSLELTFGQLRRHDTCNGKNFSRSCRKKKKNRERDLIRSLKKMRSSLSYFNHLEDESSQSKTSDQ